MSELTEQHAPSIVAGLQRFWKQVAVVVVAAGVVGLLYAVVTWTPTVSMTVGVDVATSPSGSTNTDANRATSEVAATLSSPSVISRAESDSGVGLDSVSAYSADQSSTVDVVVTAGSVGAAETGAAALVPAYQAVTSENAQTAADAQVASIDAVLDPLRTEQQDVSTALQAVDNGSGAYAQLNTEYQSLTQQIEELTQQRNNAQLAASQPAVTVSVVSDPAASNSRIGAIIRYVPVAMVGALVVCLLAIAVYARRRPWVTSPEVASAVLDTPLLAVGPRRSRFVRTPPTDVVPVVAHSVQHSLADGLGLVYFLPVGQDGHGGLPAGLAQRTDAMVRDVAETCRQNGYHAVVAEVGGDGHTRFITDAGPVLESELMWIDGATNGDELVHALRQRRIDADLVLATASPDLQLTASLELVSGSDRIVLVVLDGEWLDPLVAARRELSSLDREPIGLVVDPPE